MLNNKNSTVYRLVERAGDDNRIIQIYIKNISRDLGVVLYNLIVGEKEIDTALVSLEVMPGIEIKREGY